jgi:hypothetical protein
MIQVRSRDPFRARVAVGISNARELRAAAALVTAVPPFLCEILQHTLTTQKDLQRV